MTKGFSLHISPQKTDVQSFISEEYDNVYSQSPNFDFLLEGVLLNKKKLLQEYALNDFETLLRELFSQKKEQLIKELEGEFRGFIFDKLKNKIFVFTNITSTQRVFYGKFKEQIFIDTSLLRLTKTLNLKKITAKPDVESLYQLLCFSNLTERKTPIAGVSKLLDAHYLEVDCATVESTEKEYFDLSGVAFYSKDKKAAINDMHEVFKESVLLEYEKDTELGTDHLALLSGGLDSRVAMMYALQNSKNPGNALCFSHSGYFDHTISEKIAADFDIHYEFIPLDGGNYLKKIDELTELSEGMVFFTGGIHVQHAIDNLKYENFALFHSGQIGDGVLGGFNTEPVRKKPTNFKIVENQKFLPKVQILLDETLKNYETEELFLLRNIAYNRTVLGAHVFQQKRYQTSPFMTKDFLRLAISLPEEWKFNHRFYLDWVRENCPEATKYRWERTLMKPNAHWKTNFGDQVLKRGFKILNNKILKTPQNSSMYPYQYYFEQDEEIQRYYQKYFDENFARLDDYPELQSDVRELFKTHTFSAKSQAVNILAIFKLFFKK